MLSSCVKHRNGVSCWLSADAGTVAMGATASRKAPAVTARERVLPMTFMAHVSLHVWISCEQPASQVRPTRRSRGALGNASLVANQPASCVCQSIDRQRSLPDEIHQKLTIITAPCRLEYAR